LVVGLDGVDGAVLVLGVAVVFSDSDVAVVPVGT
jgi:hypothetical protein